MGKVLANQVWNKEWQKKKKNPQSAPFSKNKDQLRSVQVVKKGITKFTKKIFT